MQQPIAILDSGVGGLTVVKEVMRQLPQERIVYFGDTARAPYGPRPAVEVLLFTRQIIDYLIRFEPKMVVIACNTATAVALEPIRRELSVPVVGVIEPGARAAIKTTRSGEVGVIGTQGTIRSGAYEQALKSISPAIRVASAACPQLVPLVERGLFGGRDAQQVVEQSLSQIRGEPMDCLILGCTHYPFLSGLIAEVMGPKVTLISSAEETAREISAILAHKGMLAEGVETPGHQFFCSGDPFMFRNISESWLEKNVSVTPFDWHLPHIV